MWNPMNSSLGTLLTQADRGKAYKNAVFNSFAHRGRNGDAYVVGLDWWAWTDNGWAHSLYKEINNFGLVTQKDNAYDGVQTVPGTYTDKYGFTCGGEDRAYGSFIDAVTLANRGAIAQLLTGSTVRGINMQGITLH
jgi:hypothetical protein